jgi:hypothetical protein
VNKKKQKNFFYAGPWALSATSPWPSIKEVFTPLFSKSGRFLTASILEIVESLVILGRRDRAVEACS